VLSLANEVSDDPVLLMKAFQAESNQFGASQTTSNQQRQNRSVWSSSLFPNDKS
jgi:hypothetical protein